MKVLLLIIGLSIIFFGLVSDIVRGRPFFLGYSQILMIIVGLLIILLGYFGLKVPKVYQLIIGIINRSLRNVIKPFYRVFILIETNSLFSILVLLVIIGLFIWPTLKSYQSPDVAYYLSLAKNIFYGNGYVNPDLSPNFYRGPVFPLLIALSFKTLGYQFISAYIMMRIFWALTILATFFLGKSLFNRRVGFFSSVLVLFTGIINNIYQYIWTDGVLTFFIIISLLAIIRLLDNNKGYRWAIISGVLLGLAYLVKQSAIVFVPLPFLIFLLLRKYRNKQVAIKNFIFIGTFLLFFVGWMAYIYLAGGPLIQAARDINQGLAVLSYIPNSIKNIFIHNATTSQIVATDKSSSILKIFEEFYIKGIGYYFWYKVLFPITLLFILLRSIIKKNEASLILLISVFLYGFLIPSGVVVDFGPRQYLYFYIALLIGIVALIDFVVQKFPTFLSTFTVFIVILFLVTFQYQNTGVLDARRVKDSQTMDYFASDLEIANWIDSNIQLDEKILTVERQSNKFHILTKGNRQIFFIDQCKGISSHKAAKKCSPPYLFLWSNRGVIDPDQTRDKILGITETSLIDIINNEKIKYIILTPKIHFLSVYFYNSPSYEYVDQVDEYAIFRVKSIAYPYSEFDSKGWETCIGMGTPEYLSNLRNKKPSKYSLNLSTIYEPWLGLTDEYIQQLIQWKGCMFNSEYQGFYSKK